MDRPDHCSNGTFCAGNMPLDPDKMYLNYYAEEEKGFLQNYKEDIYIAMLSKIVLNIEESIDIIFDAFNKRDFEARIIERISRYDNVMTISPKDSQIEPGLQLIDNMCSILRMKISGNDKNDFYLMIEEWVQEV